VYLLCRVEIFGLFYGSDDRISVKGRKLVLRRNELLALLIIEREHRRTILGAHVVALAIERSWVVNGEEHVQDDFSGHDLWIKDDGNALGVAGGAGADLSIVRIAGVPADVSGDDSMNAARALVNRIQAPEATAGQDEGRQLGVFELQ